MSGSEMDRAVKEFMKFEKLAERFEQDYRSIEVTLIAAKQSGRAHILLAAEAVFRPCNPAPRASSEFESGSVLHQHYWLSIGDRKTLQENLSNRIVFGSDPPVEIRTGEENTEAALNPPQLNFQRLRENYNNRNEVTDRRFSLTWTGAMPCTIFGEDAMDALEKDLGGFSRLEELVSAKTTMCDARRDRVVCFELAVPMLIKGSLERQHDEAHGCVEIEGGLDRNQIQMFVRELESGLAHRHLRGLPHSVRLDELTWDAFDLGVRANFKHKLSRDLSAELQFKFRGEEWIEPLRDPEAVAAMRASSKALFAHGVVGQGALGLGGAPAPAASDSSRRREVFLVHGRDAARARGMKAFLSSLGLTIIEWTDAIALTGKPSADVWEIIQAGMNAARAIVVLLTADDEAQLRPELRNPEESTGGQSSNHQARPNVIFEAGAAMMKWPERTVLVEIAPHEMFSDLRGIHSVRFDGSIGKRQELRDKLDIAQCELKPRGDAWHTAGKADFDGARGGPATPPEVWEAGKSSKQRPVHQATSEAQALRDKRKTKPKPLRPSGRAGQSEAQSSQETHSGSLPAPLGISPVSLSCAETPLRQVRIDHDAFIPRGDYVIATFTVSAMEAAQVKAATLHLNVRSQPTALVGMQLPLACVEDDGVFRNLPQVVDPSQVREWRMYFSLPARLVASLTNVKGAPCDLRLEVCDSIGRVRIERATSEIG